MKIIPFLSVLFIAGASFSQDIKLKKGSVFFDDVEIFSTSRESAGNDLKVVKKSSSEELIYFQNNDNGTTYYTGDDYVKIIFSCCGKTLKSKSLVSYPYSNILKKMGVEKVFDKEGNFNLEKLELFISKYE